MEIERARRKPVVNLDAYDYYLRGMAALHRGTRESIDDALPLFRRAIEFDPDFASAHAMAAWCYCWRKVNGWLRGHSEECDEGARLARRAVELDKNDAVALTRAGHALAHLSGDLPAGIVLVDRALALNPNLAGGWFLGAFLRLWHGQTDEAINYFTRAMRLSPLDPELYRMQAGVAVAHLFSRRYEEAIVWAEKATSELPGFLMAVAVIAAAQALVGQQEAAIRTMALVRGLDPALRLRNLQEWLPVCRAEDLAILAEGLRKAGLPES